jgi:hypothetical protein
MPCFVLYYLEHLSACPDYAMWGSPLVSNHVQDKVKHVAEAVMSTESCNFMGK